MFPFPLGSLLAFLVGFMVLGGFDDGDSGMRFDGLRVGVGQTGAAVGQPWIDGATDGTLEGASVRSKDVG